MKHRLLDILACPIDKTWPLKLQPFEEKELQSGVMPNQDEKTKVVCSYYCGRKKILLFDEEKDKVTSKANEVNYQSDCFMCLTKEIVAGIIYCPTCKNYYPIVEDIPMMLKAELRNEDIEREFTSKWAKEIKEFLEKQK